MLISSFFIKFCDKNVQLFFRAKETISTELPLKTDQYKPETDS